MLWQEHGINWNDYPPGFKRGRFIEPKKLTKTTTYTHKKTGETCTAEAAVRTVWEAAAPPVFTREPDWVHSRIPRYD
jgi:hypothetical protein